MIRLNRPTGFAAAAVVFYLSILAAWGSAFGARPPLSGKLISLRVEGPAPIQDMMEAFLTEQGFVIVDDEHVPVLDVSGRVEKSGDPMEGSVVYRVNKLRLRSSEGNLFYSSTDRSAQGYGTRETADENARHLLKEYLSKDEKLMSRLNGLSTATYFQLSPRALKRDIADIRKTILAMAMAMEKDPEVKARLNELSRNQKQLEGELSQLAKQMKAGNGRVSTRALLETQHQLLRALKTPYLISGQCEGVEGRNFSRVGAVLITVPKQGARRMRSGSYAIYGDNQRLIYEQTERYPGPRVFSSLDLLKISSMGPYFSSPDQYLAISAVDYHPEDRALVLSRCDADAVVHANSNGESPNAIFLEGRVILIERDTE